jgi:hypothetical protein
MKTNQTTLKARLMQAFATALAQARLNAPAKHAGI